MSDYLKGCELMQQAILNFLDKFNLPLEVLIGIISAIPVIEVRGSIPIAILGFDMPPLNSALVSFIGSMLPVPVILLAATKVLAFLEKTRTFGRMARYFQGKANSKKADNIKKYGPLGLIVFVGIPLPGTGVWTGSLIAALLGLDFKRSFFSVMLGNIVAIIIMTLLAVFFGHLL